MNLKRLGIPAEKIKLETSPPASRPIYICPRPSTEWKKGRLPLAIRPVLPQRRSDWRVRKTDVNSLLVLEISLLEYVMIVFVGLVIVVF